MNKIRIYIFLLLATSVYGQQEDKVYNKHDHHPEGEIKHEDDVPTSLNIKVMPAVFASTLGIEFEYPINNASSIGLNILARYGRLDNPRISKPVDYFDAGYRAEIAYKYYFAKKGPTGIYGQAFAGYSKLLYDNGNTRPFALSIRNMEVDGDPRTNVEFKLPKPYTAGLGVGYQTQLIGKHIIGNIMLGSQLGFDAANKVFFSVYLAPSIGYAF